jgi:predicted nuclease with TOPRIM domain
MTAPHDPETDRQEAPARANRPASPLERLASFRFAYLAIFSFVVAAVFTLRGLERSLTAHFAREVAAAAVVDPADGPVAAQIHARMRALLERSPWIRYGQVRVHALVLAADGRTLLFAGPNSLPTLAPTGLQGALLPARSDVHVEIPYNAVLANAVLIAYAALLVATLALHTRRLARKQQLALDGLVAARDTAAQRAAGIERELASVRERLASVEPETAQQAHEIAALAEERSALLARLDALEARAEALRRGSARAAELEEEHRALEQLLEEASRDLGAKDGELEALRAQLKSAGRSAARSARDADALGRRFQALYKQLEVDERALTGIAELGDESLRLRAEEALKTLNDEPDSSAVRRKVGGLPPHLAIFELGFAGKGRIYFTRGQARRFRVLGVGAKNTQNEDLEYMRRLPKGT